MSVQQKVAVVTPGVFVIPSGRSSSVERVIEKTMSLVPEGLDVRVFGRSAGHLPAKDFLGSVPCYRIPGGSAYLSGILRHLKNWMPDTADVHNRPALAYGLKRHLPQIRVFLTLHSTTFISPCCLPQSKAEVMLSSVDGLIVNSAYLRDDVLRRFPKLRTPIYVNPLGVSLEDFTPRWTPAGEAVRQARLADYGWRNRKIILFVGRLIHGKGVHRLLEALPGIVSREKDALAVIVGSAFYGVNRDTAYVKSLRKLAGQMKDHTAFLPFVPYPQVADLYNLADVVLVPSLEDEAFGLVNLEAMASAVPVVASAVGGIPEIIRHEQTGLLLPKGSGNEMLEAAVLRILEDSQLQRSLGLAGRELARSTFRWQRCAERWTNLMSMEQPPTVQRWSV
ncbi:glycosyltransferase family 4 protein [Paenibacillus sp. J22TS3]|uniref:glycosyltransferase family 4 protein n=1 Tax=Paenibacillus sp. J22TS3 TaxID=2807192 RepID=UPI001B0E0B29|nr:glycosyltransferase family 4 protein [Paenibacillus sp. J22TS3]GIP24100.1 spore coat protein SA [Paenibacillus sp. J22TS3]